jgi:hypothetical protein
MNATIDPKTAPPRSHRSDDVADPTNEIEERAFRLRSGLTLNSRVELRRSAESLRPDNWRSTDDAEQR